MRNSGGRADHGPINDAGEDPAQTTIIGRALAAVTDSWPFFAPLPGRRPRIFEGSATAANLTFGGIQDPIAGTLGFERTSILALPSVGAAMGKMVAVGNIIPATSGPGSGESGGFVPKRALMPFLVYGLVAGLSGFILT